MISYNGSLPPVRWRPKGHGKRRQQGASLVMSLLMLLAVQMLGMSAAQTSLQGEKASRNDQDRQIALQAAEAALIDAERDMETSERRHLFSQNSVEGFTAQCSDAAVDIYLGLCRHAVSGGVPAWLAVDFETQSVPYGYFTNRVFPNGDGPLTAQLPRYLIELMSYKKDVESTAPEEVTYFYRITAIGFGARTSTQVVLQTFYRKRDDHHKTVVPLGRFSWREISNWQELRDALA